MANESMLAIFTMFYLSSTRWTQNTQKTQLPKALLMYFKQLCKKIQLLSTNKAQHTVYVSL